MVYASFTVSLQGWISDVRAGSFTSCGNQIKSSCRFVAFSAEQTGGGILGLVSLDPGPDERWTVSQIPCHADLITDFDFSPFDDSLLATCSADETVKVWRVPEPGQDGGPASPEVTLSPRGGRLETVLFHPAADGVLATAAAKTANIWDTSRQSPLAGCPLLFQSAAGHPNNKDSRVIWIKDSDNILTTGFNQMREREVKVWDARKLGSSLGSVSLGTSAGMVFQWSFFNIFVKGRCVPLVSASSSGFAWARSARPSLPDGDRQVVTVRNAHCDSQKPSCLKTSPCNETFSEEGNPDVERIGEWKS
ncbi:CORO7 protein, partial [Atractosteus spatula]|nr:CORO7 protein [Atractosteus spatula]